MASVVDSTCRGCDYYGTNSYGRCCNYNYRTGHSRGCPPGEGCDKYTGDPAKRPQLSHKDRVTSTKASEAFKPTRPPKLTPEEAYERQKAHRHEVIRKLRERTQGRQKAALLAFKQATGETDESIALKLGIPKSRVQKWNAEAVAAEWDLLAKLGIEKPDGID